MLGDQGCLCECRYLLDDGMAIDGQTLGVIQMRESDSVLGANLLTLLILLNSFQSSPNVSMS